MGSTSFSSVQASRAKSPHCQSSFVGSVEPTAKQRVAAPSDHISAALTVPSSCWEFPLCPCVPCSCAGTPPGETGIQLLSLLFLTCCDVS